MQKKIIVKELPRRHDSMASRPEKNRSRVQMLPSHHQNPRTLLSKMTVELVVQELRKRGSSKAREGMSRFGIRTSKAFGVSIPQIRDLAKKIGTNHELAQLLWITGIHEARMLASMVDDPTKVSEDQMEKWKNGRLSLTRGMSWMVAVETCSTKPDLLSERPMNGPGEKRSLSRELALY